MTGHAQAFPFIITNTPLSGWDEAWKPDPESVLRIGGLGPDASVAVTKRAPDGSIAATYSGTVQRTQAPLPWFEIAATWTLGAIDVSGLVFEPGDSLREFFSARHPFNAFALFSSAGTFKGWYGNVTFPAFLIGGKSSPELIWHDLYLDTVILPNGSISMLDDDELEQSGLHRTHPRFVKAIETARRDLITSLPMFSKIL